MHKGNVAFEETIELAVARIVPCEGSVVREESAALIPSDKTPQEFYAEITKRADVRQILEELATA